MQKNSRKRYRIHNIVNYSLSLHNKADCFLDVNRRSPAWYYILHNHAGYKLQRPSNVSTMVPVQLLQRPRLNITLFQGNCNFIDKLHSELHGAKQLCDMPQNDDIQHLNC